MKLTENQIMRLEDAIDEVTTALQENGYDDVFDDVFEAMVADLVRKLDEI